MIRAIAAAGICASAFLSGCASTPASSKMPKDVEARALKRWELLIAHKAEDAYAFLTPGFRATKTQAAYAGEMNNRPVQWTAVHFMDKQCEADTCTVHLTVDFNVPVRGAPNASTISVVEEKWVQVSGSWYFLQDQFGSSPQNR